LIDQLIADSVMGWIRDADPRYIERAASENRDLLSDLLKRYPPWMRRFARGYVGDERIRSMRMLGDGDFSELIDRALKVRPQVGEILWAHEAWFLRQVRQLRDAFVDGR
jgi:hypothetical protein